MTIYAICRACRRLRPVVRVLAVAIIVALPTWAGAAEAVTPQSLQQAIASAQQFQTSGDHFQAFEALRPTWEAMKQMDPAKAAESGFANTTQFSQNKAMLYGQLTEVALELAEQLSAQGQHDTAIHGIDYLLEQNMGNNIPARMARAQLFESKGDLVNARQAWEDVRNRSTPGLQDWGTADSNMKRLQEALANAPAITPSVTDSTTPAPIAATPQGTPAAPVNIAKTAENAIQSGKELVEGAPEKIKNVDVEGVAGKILRAVQTDTFITYAVGLAAIILGYWVIWFLLMKLLVKMGNIRASMWLPRVKKYGLAAFIAFIATGIHFDKKPKVKRNCCPNCNKPIDDLDAYASLNFYVCPFCNESIKPIFSLNDYITHLTNNIQRIAGTGRGSNGHENPLERDAMAKLVRCIMTKAARERSTDLHVESTVDGINVRARRDGMLGEFLKFDRSVGAPMLNALMIQAQLDITQHMVPQDGKFSVWVDGADIDIRLNSAPGPYGPNVTMRLLDRRRITVDSTQLGLEGRSLELFERSIRHAHGLILVTGPSGSGKSTTLYVALNTLNNGDRSIITIEDPIEYQLPGLKQMQVNVAQNFTFATGLRSILRQDPDVIMVGEIRDKETADIALDAAITGHLVFTTLHTIDSASAITRMRDLGIEPRRYAEALDLVLAQRLIRLNCLECKKTYKPQQKELDATGLVPNKDQVFQKGAGCDICNHTGFFGRTGLFEALEMSGPIKEILETNVSTPVIRELARKGGMRTLREEGVLRALQGKTTLDEILRVTT